MSNLPVRIDIRISKIDDEHQRLRQTIENTIENTPDIEITNSVTNAHAVAYIQSDEIRIFTDKQTHIRDAVIRDKEDILRAAIDDYRN